jgi:hypothetical protein
VSGSRSNGDDEHMDSIATGNLSTNYINIRCSVKTLLKELITLSDFTVCRCKADNFHQYYLICLISFVILY